MNEKYDIHDTKFSSFYDKLARLWLDIRCGALTPFLNYDKVQSFMDVSGDIRDFKIMCKKHPVCIYFSEAISREEVRMDEGSRFSDVIMGVWLSRNVPVNALTNGGISLELRNKYKEAPLETYFIRPGEFVTAIGGRTFFANGPNRVYGGDIYLTISSKREVPPWLKKHIRFVYAAVFNSDVRRDLYTQRAENSIGDLGDGKTIHTTSGYISIFDWASRTGRYFEDVSTIEEFRKLTKYGEYPILYDYSPHVDNVELHTVNALNVYRQELIAAAWAPHRHVNWCLDTSEQAEIAMIDP